MDKVIDAHLHVDTTMDNPVSYLIAKMNDAGINYGVLIVNTKEESRCIQKEKAIVQASDRLKLIAGLNINEEDPLYILNSLSDCITLCGIKLHPLLYRYTKNDFEKVYEAILNIKNQKQIANIVIDTLFNDEYVENHIGIELGIYLARRFQEKKIVLAHAGSTRLLECCAFTRKIPNIYYDLSFSATYFNHTSIRWDMINYIKYTNDRMMYGSDFPSFGFEESERALREICDEANLNEIQRMNVFYNTAKRVYGN